VGKSPRLLEAINRVIRYGPSDLNIFIAGESGTGKELLARAVHSASSRRDEQFLAVNCSNLVDNLIESELFGHVKGSFTGANSDKMGLLAQADGGTLFLDEIGDINEKIQSLLLRVIQEGEYTRIGETRVRKVDIRFVTATNKDLHKQIDQGHFCGDLYFRIVEEEIRLPALRERFEDLPLLAAHFVTKFEKGRRIFFERGFFRELRRYNWPGNVRELEASFGIHEKFGGRVFSAGLSWDPFPVFGVGKDFIAVGHAVNNEVYLYAKGTHKSMGKIDVKFRHLPVTDKDVALELDNVRREFLELIKRFMKKPDYWPAYLGLEIDGEKIWAIGLRPAPNKPYPYLIFDIHGKEIVKGVLPQRPLLIKNKKIYFVDTDKEDNEFLIIAKI